MGLRRGPFRVLLALRGCREEVGTGAGLGLASGLGRGPIQGGGCEQSSALSLGGFVLKSQLSGYPSPYLKCLPSKL